MAVAMAKIIQLPPRQVEQARSKNVFDTLRHLKLAEHLFLCSEQVTASLSLGLSLSLSFSLSLSLSLLAVLAPCLDQAPFWLVILCHVQSESLLNGMALPGLTGTKQKCLQYSPSFQVG